MMQPNADQKIAIEAKNRSLLISASAGTGKTTTLCARILSRMTDEKYPLSIDRVLVVTFTNASAADLKRKMGDSLRGALKDPHTPKDRKELLKKQLRLLPCANIGTIDSYCYDLVRTYFDALNLSPRVRIADNTELKKVKTSLMRDAMNEMYKGSKGKAFGDLTDSFLSGYTDRDLPDLFISMYSSVNESVKGIDVLYDYAKKREDAANGDMTDGDFGKYIMQKVKDTVFFLIGEYRSFSEYLSGEDLQKASVKKCSLCCETELKYLERMSKTSDIFSLAAVIKEFGGAFGALSSIRGSEEYKRFKTARDFFKDYAAKDRCYVLLQNMPSAKRNTLLKKEGEMHRLLQELFDKYGKALWERKRQTGVLEFCDIERLAYELLYEKTGEPSAVAKSLAKEYDEIYIDEYQDVNELQNSIFTALSRDNLFVVGDIKQSIYGFRGTRSEFFNKMRGEYPLCNNADPGQKRGKVFFRENYRSAGGIVNFVNHVSRNLLGMCSDMTYDDNGDDLVCKREESGIVKPKICYVSKKGNPLFGDNDNNEAVYTAKAIRKMIANGRKPEDIAVLVRKKSQIAKIAEALDREGIKALAIGVKNFFENPEIYVLHSILEAVNNPTNDICLAGAMKSPMFGFSLDDLAKIRKGRKKTSLFSSVTKYKEETGDKKCADLLCFIAKYRQLSKETPPDELTYMIINDCMMIPLLAYGQNAAGAEEIKENLLHFYDFARTAVSGGASDLSKMLERIEIMAKANDAGIEKPTEPVPGHVRVMTVHASKGLEFPVCWIYGTDDTLTCGSMNGAYSSSYGFQLTVKDEDFGVLRYRTEADNVIADERKEKDLNEEFRLLYVALTRAKDELYISLSVGNPGKAEEYKELGLPVPSKAMAKRNCKCISFLMIALQGREDLYDECIDDESLIALDTDCEKGEDTSAQTEAYEREKEKIAKELEERLNFEYPYKALVDLPLKKSVSSLSPSVLDEDGEETEEQKPYEDETDLQDSSEIPLKPRFIAAIEGENEYHSPAERGTATHAFMQFCNFEKLEKEGVDKELERLVNENFLPSDVAALVEKKEVSRFLQSTLYTEMKKAKVLYREQRFMISLPASDFTEDPEKKKAYAQEKLLVQGVIDGFFENEEGRIVLFDYKTDHFTDAQKKEPEKCEEILRSRHKEQLGYYKLAIEKMTGKEVADVILYSFSLGKEVKV